MLDSLGNGVKNRFMTNSSMDMGYHRENLTWPQDPLVFVNEMDINDFERRSLILKQREFENMT